MLNYLKQNVQVPFNEVISYSQEVDINAVNCEELLENFAKAKEKFYKAFGNKLIYNCGPIQIQLSEEERDKQFDEFCKHHASSTFWMFLQANKDGFFENRVIKDTPAPKGKIVPKGMKLVKAFKFFIEDKEELDKVQTEASMIIQNNTLKGNLCFSIHPLDFLSSSENNYNWRSCHALDGEYRAGNLSYMLDESTVMCYIRGEDETILPRFPKSVPWNNKKWRMLIFFSEGKDIVFAGRQYPFDLGTNILNIIKDTEVFKEIYLCDNQNRHFVEWLFGEDLWKNNWYNDELNQYIYKNGDRTSLSGYLIINDDLYKKSELIEDGRNSRHYNDLLYSSFYTPYYTWNSAHNYRESFKSVAKVKIGKEVSCLCCRNTPITESDSMFCDWCKDKLGIADKYSCCCCGERYHEDEMCWSDWDEDYICEDCYNNRYSVCVDCGVCYPAEEMYEGDDGWYCSDCWSEEDN